MKIPCAILLSVVRVRMKVKVHEQVPGNLVLKVRQRLNLQMDERNLTWHLDTMSYPLSTMLHRSFRSAQGLFAHSVHCCRYIVTVAL
jgi:hypothetical protein